MARELARLFVVLGLDDKEFQSNLNAIQKQMTALAKPLAAIGGALTAALGFSVKSFAQTGEEIGRMSRQTGFSTEMLSKLKYAAESSGGSIDEIVTSSKNLSLALVDAGQGSQKAVNAFRSLGLNYREIRAMAPEQQFMVVASALADVGDQALKTSLAQDLFGRSGYALLPMLAGGADGLQKVMDRAKALGIVFDQDGTSKAEAFSQAMKDMGAAADGLKMVVGEALAPALTDALKSIADIVIGIQEWAAANPGLFNGIVAFTAAVGGLFSALAFLGFTLPLVAAGITALLSPIGLVVIALGALVGLIATVAANWSTISSVIWSTSGSISGNVTQGQGGFWGGSNLGMASGGIVTRPTLAMVGESGPEAVIPLSKVGGGGVGATVNIYPQALLGSKRDILAWVREGLLEVQGSNVTTGIV